MSRRDLLILLAVLVALVLAVWFVVGRTGKDEPAGGTGTDSPAAAEPGETPTRGRVPENIVVPDAGAQNTGEIAVPKISVQAAPGVESKLRKFEINIEDNLFSPDTLAVNQGDTVQINFKAVDDDYDVVQPDYGLKLAIVKGAVKLMSFDAVSEGKYTFYCESCGGPAKGPVGYVMVVKKQ